jgi:DNA repair exonuclease SbcCD ATPase subunit
LSYREKGNLTHSLQVTQQQAKELRQELEKLQAAQEELKRQHNQLEDAQEDSVQEGARARRELERRWAAHPPPWVTLTAPLQNTETWEWQSPWVQEVIRMIQDE